MGITIRDDLQIFKLLLLLSCLLFSCGRSSHWAFDQIHSDQKEHSSTKLVYYSPSGSRGIDIEFLKTSEHLKIYLNIHSIPFSQAESKTHLVLLYIDDQKIETEAYQLEGGQRFLLSESILSTLTDALLQEKKVALSIGSYRTVIQIEDFQAKFQRLQHPFPFQNPFQLPL